MTKNRESKGRSAETSGHAKPARAVGSPGRDRYRSFDEKSALVVRNHAADATPSRANTQTRTFKISG
jgi:hypothetical protein